MAQFGELVMPTEDDSNRWFRELMPELSEDYRANQILERLQQEPSGFTFNRYALVCRDILSRGPFSKRLRQLVDAGLVTRERIGRQKVLYRHSDLEKLLHETVSNLETLESSYEYCVRLALKHNGSKPAEVQMGILEHLKKGATDSINQLALWFASWLDPSPKASSLVATKALELQARIEKQHQGVIEASPLLKEEQEKPIRVHFSRIRETVKVGRNGIQARWRLRPLGRVKMKSS